MFRRANSRAVSRSPAWACSAPQQTCAPTSFISQPLAANTRFVASLTCLNNPSITQPVKTETEREMGLIGLIGLMCPLVPLSPCLLVFLSGDVVINSESAKSAFGEIQR